MQSGSWLSPCFRNSVHFLSLDPAANRPGLGIVRVESVVPSVVESVRSAVVVKGHNLSVLVAVWEAVRNTFGNSIVEYVLMVQRTARVISRSLDPDRAHVVPTVPLD